MPPAGFKRSRALWEQAAREDTTIISKGFLRAALYELQPVRYSEFAACRDSALLTGRSLLTGAAALFQKRLPATSKRIARYVIKDVSVRQWKMVAAAVAYYAFVRWIHAALDAGPVVLIVSALVAIFTVGLSDNEGSDGQLSAYSVFNKGFQKLMGSVDADALLQQHVGGGMMMLAGMPQQRPLHDDGVREQEDEDELLPERFLRRRRQQQQQQRAPAAAAAIRDEPDNDGDEQRDDPPQQPPQPPNNNNNNRARRTGKKARRGNAVEQRRELRAQREAAIAMGFGGGGDDAAAMFRLVEDQVAFVGDDENE